MSGYEHIIPDDIYNQILAAVTEMTDLEFGDFFDFANIFIQDKNLFIYGFNSLSKEQQLQLKADCLASLTQARHTDSMATPTFFNRSTKFIEFVHKELNGGRMVSGFNDYLELFIHLNASIQNNTFTKDALVDVWSYIVEALSDGILNPVEATEDDINMYLSLGDDLIPHMAEHMSWWFPMYLSIPVINMNMDKYLKDFSCYTEIPGKQLEIYKSLGLSDLDCILQHQIDKSCTSPTAYELIELD